MRGEAWIVLALAAVLSACGGGDDSRAPVTLARSVVNVQCEPPRTTLRALDAELQAAGIEASARRCASDGILYCAACGCATSYLRVIELPVSQAMGAQALGYRPLNVFPIVEPMACPPQ